MALNEDPVQEALEIIRGYHAEFITFRNEQVKTNTETAEAITVITAKVTAVETVVNDSIKENGPILEEINTSLRILKDDKLIRESAAAAVEKSPWGLFKTAFVRAGVVFVVGGIWVLIGWSALSLYNSFKDGQPVAAKTEQRVN